MSQVNKTISRRSFVGGTAAVGAGAVLSGLFGGPIVKTASAAFPKGGNAPVNLIDYHCSLVHKSMSDKLTRIVADPTISAAETSKALRTTFCPCCHTQINASYPVVPLAEMGKAYG